MLEVGERELTDWPRDSPFLLHQLLLLLSVAAPIAL